MRAIRFSQFGNPRDVLALENIPSPEPGSGQVRVRFTHRPINPSDLLTVQGIYPVAAKPPASPGLEGVGRVDALGEGVSGLSIGQRVISLAAAPGTWAERFVIPADRALPMPDAVPDPVASQTLANPVTAWALVNDEIDMQPGEWLLQTAAASTLGKLVIQLARRRGFRTLNVVRRRAHVDDVLAAGGDAVVCTEDESLSERVSRIVGADGVAWALDSVGGEVGAEVVSCLRPGGTMLSVGLLSGTTLGTLDARSLIFNGTTVRGFWIIEWFGRRPADVIGRALEEVVTLLATGELRLSVEAQYPLDDFREAVDHSTRPGRHGKILLVG